MRSALLVALLLAHLASAADDAPVVLQAGDPAPFPGLLAPTDLAVRRAQELAACRVENPELRKAVLDAPSPALVVVLVVLGVFAGAAGGYGVARAMARP